MISETLVAPALSTTQDEVTFEFSKVETAENRQKRSHLGPELTVESNSEISATGLRDSIIEYYNLDQISKFLASKDSHGHLKFKKITLQFPDSLVCDSAIIVQVLQDNLKRLNETEHAHSGQAEHADNEAEIDFTHSSSCKAKPVDIELVKPCTGKCGAECKNGNGKKQNNDQQVWILADTSYSPCCIDEVAAEHVSADTVVHFGDACLSPIEKLPAVYVFGRPYLDQEAFITKFKETYSDLDAKIMLMADTPYSYQLYDIYTKLKDEYNKLAYADIDFEICGPNATIMDRYPQRYQGKTIKVASRIICGLPEDDLEYMEEDSYDELTQEYYLFHINKPADPRLLVLSTKFGDITTFDSSYNEISQGPFPSLMRRYRLMHMARNAGTVGILVNTLSLSNTKKLLNKVIKWIKNAGKKHYMFVVGKPNVAKLANFENIEVWCVLGCGQSGIIIDSFGDYYKPIITPYELQMALNFEVTWTGKWVTDFQEVMQQEGYESEEECEKNEEQSTNNTSSTDNTSDANEEDKDDEYAPTFNPVTGKLVASQPLRQLKHLEIEMSAMKSLADSLKLGESATEGSNEAENQLVKKFSTTLSIKNTVSTSADYLQTRQWTGLGSDYNQQELDAEENGVDFDKGAEIEEGIDGVARGYVTDRDLSSM